ncbi:hypothetical protein HY570_03655 [Candidatus Micrarchaeota archaeon]|nr:hypothetical protein [Candidatus Micrarchaeota archaeon]
MVPREIAVRLSITVLLAFSLSALLLLEDKALRVIAFITSLLLLFARDISFIILGKYVNPKQK